MNETPQPTCNPATPLIVVGNVQPSETVLLLMHYSKSNIKRVFHKNTKLTPDENTLIIAQNLDQIGDYLEKCSYISIEDAREQLAQAAREKHQKTP